jgi:hypothetical protein
MMKRQHCLKPHLMFHLVFHVLALT